MSDLRGYTDVSDGPDLAEAERALRDELGVDGEWIDAFQLGLDMAAFHASPAGQHIVEKCQEAINDAFNVFLDAAPDELDGTEVRRAHFNANIYAALAKLMHETILAGRDAVQGLDEGQEAS